LGEEAARQGIVLSIHAPYYINFAATDPGLLAKTKKHLLDSLRAARWMGATRVVFHPGSAGPDRGAALERAKEAVAQVIDQAADENLDDIILAPETLGKLSYLGLLDEVLELCTLSPHMLPTVDFGHIHALTQGALTDRAAYAAVLDRVVERLGEDRTRRMHMHFSPVEFTAAGERKHWSIKDGYGPDFRPLAEELAERGYAPILICESNGTQAEDAVTYQQRYLETIRAKP
jgi:deoxyribonuclease-4